jgi:cellulose synthase/poly-beta-1,6-N-acetylglucosamine synthase-like glycosyltransferase
MELLLVAALVMLAYTYAGYPALIGLLAWARPRAVCYGEYAPPVVVVIVAYNEAGGIGTKIDACLGLDYPAEKLRVLVVSDGSSDGTNEVVAGHPAQRVSLLACPVRRGKAACLNDAIATCTEEIIVLCDVRQRLDRSCVRHLIANFADPSVGAVSGELIFDADGITGFGEGVDAYWRYEKMIRQAESRYSSVVGATGALYALRRTCFQAIPTDTVLDDVLIPMNAVMGGWRVVFEGRARAYDRVARDPAQERVRKVRTLAGNYQLITAHPRLLVPFRNPVFLQFVSHKVMRLISPFLLVVILLTSAMLAPHEQLYQVLFGAQILAYALPALGWLWPRFGSAKIVRLVTAFVALNWFAVLGLVEFLRNRRIHLWRPAQQPATGRTDL